MKNVEKRHIKTCLLFTENEFAEIIKRCFDEDTVITYALDGMLVTSPHLGAIDINTIHTTLAKYFDVEVVFSIHTEICEYSSGDEGRSEIGIWISIRDKHRQRKLYFFC